MSALERYLRELHLLHGSGAAVNETSYYPALATLLNAVGRELKPRVHCIVNPKNRGAGIPDGGLFTPDQLGSGAEGAPLLGLLPARGAIEAKGAGEDARAVAASAQVAKYWGMYRQVLVTNLRDFILVGQDANGRKAILESYRLAEDEDAFWTAAALAEATEQVQGERFVEFLKRVMLQAAPLATPRDVAWFLASYARDARVRLERADLPALTAVRTALESALGLAFEGERGAHFFRSTLVQTLFYGVFSAWVLWCRERPAESTERFDWRLSAWSLRVPMIAALFAEVAMPTRLEPLGLVEVLDWTGAALNRVDRAAFFARFEQCHAVQYFYEPFLEAFDPELRRQLGVWYTPPEIVRYMVERVDTALREELGRPDGLADPDVYVLDPCCGTGTYLVETLRRIDATLRERGTDALGASDIKRAAAERVFGFELLPAPFVVAHLQLGLLLQQLGAPLGPGERTGVYLTNALTGWEPPAGPQARLPFPGLEEERDAANAVKRSRPILVVLGNPPYSGYAGVAMGEERDLSTAYRVARGTKQPQGQGLNDLYVRFYRMAERRIVEQTGQGVVCYISNYSWLDGLSFTALRERYLEAFDRIWIDNLNGDKYKTGKLTPQGDSDPSIFSTEWNKEGIQVGTAIALLVRTAPHTPSTALRFRDLWGRNKRAELLETALQDGASLYQTVTPPTGLGLPFVPLRADAAYERWPLLPELFPTSFPGVKTSRDDVVVDIDRERLVRRMEQYFDPAIGDEQMRRIAPGAMESTARFNAETTRAYLVKRGFRPENIVRYCYRPFDMRWLYWEPETKLLDEKRAEYAPHVFAGNVWLSAGQRNRKEAFYQPQFTTVLADHHIVESNVGMFPLYLAPAIEQASLFDVAIPTGPKANLTDRARSYIEALSVGEDVLFYHCLSILHSPEYRAENAGALRQDWPRVPLPDEREALLASDALGRQVAALLDTERAVPGVTAGAIRRELQGIAPVTRVGSGELDPGTDLALSVGWGHAGQNGVTMPGKGKARARAYTAEERAAIAQGAAALGLDADEALARLGEDVYDVYLNGVAYWRGVPAEVWGYTIGGYQVMKKWLSYRERELLGRALRPDEVREMTHMARRIAAIRLLEPALDANYRRAGEAAAAGPEVDAAAR